MRAPIAPGNGGRSNPARVEPQRVQVMSMDQGLERVCGKIAIFSCPFRDPLEERAPHIGGAGELPPRVRHFREAEQLEEANVRPAHIELVPLRLELAECGSAGLL